MSVLVETTIGDLVFDLYTDERPRSTLNFLKLCKIKYYNYCLFHSVRRNFIAQCGDPTGTGRGGESIYSSLYGSQAKYFDLETKPRIKHKTKGTISFVNNGNNKHGSQFFITMGEGLDFLDGKHTIFGMLAEGFDTLELLNETICDDNHKPYQDVRITHTIILYDPYEDPKGLTIPERSPEPTKEQLESCRIGADEDIDEDKKKSKDEVQKEIEEKELQIGTKILETVGDIHDTDEKPPENVLFVCKLNPVTNAEDLKIIFSRFGKIRSCEIIKDEKTGDSLCYGFVEFKEVEACEKAYFKMDNVLIDDRRIHVDFCQSVGKNKGRKWQKGNSHKMPAAGKEKAVTEKYELKSNKPKKDKDKYSMVFHDEPVAIATKTKKKEPRDRERLKEKKKKYESESEEEKTSTVKSIDNKKESRKRKNSIRSPSESESEPPPRDVESKRSSEKRSSEKFTHKEKGEGKRKSRKERYSESESESDGERSKKEKKKKKSIERKVEMKSRDESPRERKKMIKKKKEIRASDSDSETEKREVVKQKKKKKTDDYYSDSDEPDSRTHPKKARKDKYVEKKKRRVSESESETKSYRESKQKNINSKKTTKSNKLKSRHIDDSDTEDYGDSVKEKPTSSTSRRKRIPASSHDESSDEDDRRSSKASHSVRANSSDDDRRKSKSHHKKPQTKKKSRKRESSYSESSD